MSDSKLIIRHQTLPSRCEICHQSDQFNPATGQCRRCDELPADLLHPVSIHRNTGQTRTPALKPVSLVGATAGFFIFTGFITFFSIGLGLLGLRLVWTEIPWLMVLGGLMMSVSALVGFASAGAFVFTTFYGLMTLLNATTNGMHRLTHRIEN